MGILTFVHFFSFFTQLFLAIYVFIQNRRSWLNRSCAALIASFSIWSFGRIFIHNYQTTKAAATIFENISSIGWCSFSALFLWFVLVLTQQRRILSKWIIYLVLFFPPMIFIYQQWAGNLVEDHVHYSYGWPGIWSSSIWADFFYLYMSIFVLAGLHFLFSFEKKTSDQIKKKQIRMISITGLICLPLGTLVDIILPLFRIHIIPNIANVVVVVWVIGLAYASVKYKFLTITPATAAENIISTMGDALILLDVEGKVVTVNKAAFEMLGYGEHELIHKSLDLFLYNDKETGTSGEMLVRGAKVGRCDLTFMKKNGKKVNVSFLSSVLKDQEANLVGIVCIARDISRRIQIERELKIYRDHLEELVEARTVELRKSREKYRTLTNNLNVGICRCTMGPTGKFVEANPAAIKIFRYKSRKEFLALQTAGIYPSLKTKKQLEDAILKKGFVRHTDLKLKRKDGIHITCFISAVGIKDARGHYTYYDAVIQDITEQRQLERQLFMAQKMEAIGRLSGGIAHDFNNQLTSIIGYSEMTVRKLGEASPLKDYLKRIIKAADHSKELTQQLLAFSRRAMIQPRVLNLNQVLETFQHLLMPVIGEDIIFEFVPDDELGNIKADPIQIEQILMNLAVNARDAMTTGGKLVFLTQDIDLSESFVKKYPYVKPGPYVLLSVTDTGIGMEKETLSRIFDPFFTTKEQGMGTGLGLSTVYGIVKQNDGYIHFFSKPGQGTTARIYLPRVDEPAEEIMPIQDNDKLLSGDETIMVVEDEELVRELAVKILSECGYRVLEAKNGIEALSLWKKTTTTVDLLLTDVVMPIMSGRQLAGKLVRLNPKLRVLYMTGYSESVVNKQMESGKNSYYLRKPFTSNGLARQVRRMLNS